MLVLGIDTSAICASCAVCEVSENTQKVIASAFLNTRQTHSQTIIPMIEMVVSSAEIELSALDLLAVSGGPGSFTGLRIGISAVKGLAFALGKPVCNVSTLEALAFNLRLANGIVCACMDARCNQVYNALFRAKNGVMERLCDDRALFLPELMAELKQFDNETVFLVGDGAELAIKSAQHDNIFLAPPEIRFQRGESVCFAAAFNPKATAKELMPKYLRLPQAERERLAKMKGE